MKLSTEDVLHLADLSRVELTASEAEAFRDECSSILDYVDRLGNVDAAELRPLKSESRLPHADGWRPDVPTHCPKDARDAILAAFPDRSGEYLKTPAVFERPKKEKRA